MDAAVNYMDGRKPFSHATLHFSSEPIPARMSAAFSEQSIQVKLPTWQKPPVLIVGEIATITRVAAELVANRAECLPILNLDVKVVIGNGAAQTTIAFRAFMGFQSRMKFVHLLVCLLLVMIQILLVG